MKPKIKNRFARMQALAATILCFVFFVASGCGTSNPSENAEPKSFKCDVLEFMDEINLISWNISDTNITAVYPEGTDLSSISPVITVSENATVSPKSGEKTDFSDEKEITYTVTAEDGTEKVYQAQAIVLQGKIWKSTGIVDTQTDILAELEPKDCKGDYCYTILFDADIHDINVRRGPGYLSGYGFPNILRGSYEIDYTTHNICLEIGPGTLLPHWNDEELYLELINSVNYFSVQEGKLLLYFDEKKYLLFKIIEPWKNMFH